MFGRASITNSIEWVAWTRSQKSASLGSPTRMSQARRALVPDGTGVDIHTYKGVPMNLTQAVVGSRSDSAHADNRDLRALYIEVPVVRRPFCSL